MFLDQGELDSQQLVDNISQETETLAGDKVEAGPAGKEPGKKRKLILVALLVVIVVGLGYFFLFFGKGATGVSVPPLSNSGPSSSQVTTTTTQAVIEYKATKNPFAPVGSPGVNVGSSSFPTPPAASATTTVAG